VKGGKIDFRAKGKTQGSAKGVMKGNRATLGEKRENFEGKERAQSKGRDCLEKPARKSTLYLGGRRVKLSTQKGGKRNNDHRVIPAGGQ